MSRFAIALFGLACYLAGLLCASLWPEAHAETVEPKATTTGPLYQFTQSATGDKIFMWQATVATTVDGREPLVDIVFLGEKAAHAGVASADKY